MSHVGTRLCLFSQEELIGERERLDIFACPCINGLAQILEFNVCSAAACRYGSGMLTSLGVQEYFHYLWWTILGRGSGDWIKKAAG